MPASESATLLVARFLKANNYTDSFDAFIAEAGLPADAGITSPGDLTLDQLLEEKRLFDLATNFEKLGTSEDDSVSKWSLPAPERSIEVIDVPRANVLTVSMESARMDPSSSDLSQVLIVTTADRHIYILDAATLKLRNSLADVQDTPVLSCAIVHCKYLITSSMSGQVVLSDLQGHVLDKRKDHTKYIVKVATYSSPTTGDLVATAGWDNRIVLYKMSIPTLSSEAATHLGEPLATLTLPAKPEAMLFVHHPDTPRPILVVTRANSSFLSYYAVDNDDLRAIGKQNLAPHSTAWAAFTPSALALHPHDLTLLAVALSTTPHMKLVVVRMLLMAPLSTVLGDGVPGRGEGASIAAAAAARPADQALRLNAVADREQAAILLHCNTLAPQTAYSTPAVAWRPDGSGVWVNGDDGAVRGVEASSGKVVAVLKEHAAGSKVRCLWAGVVEGGEGEERRGEVVVSGGFDQRVFVRDAVRE